LHPNEEQYKRGEPMMFRKEEGNVTIFGLFLVMAAIVGFVYLTYFYGGFIVRRQAQNAVDSAALAAAIELRNRFEENMAKKADESAVGLIDEVEEEVRQCEMSRDEDDPPCPTEEDLIREKISDAALEQKLVAWQQGSSGAFDAEKDWLLVVTEKYFASDYTAEKNGDVLYDTYLQFSNEIKNAALEAAAKNDGKADVKIQFPVDQVPKLTVRGAKTYDLDALLSGSSVDVPALAATGVSDDLFPIDVSGKVPATIR
jgi:hypothetical protein